MDFATEGFCVDPRTSPAVAPGCDGTNTASLPLVWPPVQVTLAPFAIDVHEVTNLQYQYCVAAGDCDEPRAYNAVSEDQQVYFDADRFEQHPVVNVTWEQARDYCAFVDARLPTEAEWERVAKGPSATAPRRFPTDFAVGGGPMSAITQCQQAGFNGQYCRGDQRMDAVTGTTVDFVEEAGQRIYMLFGNAAEWVSTNYQQDVQCAGPAPCTREDQCPTGAGFETCVQQAKSCAACDAGVSCAHLCDGEDRSTILCEAYGPSEQPLSGADFEASAVGVNKVYRGGHVSLVGAANSYALCQYRASRSNAKPEPAWAPTASQPWLGFRCARSL